MVSINTLCQRHFPTVRGLNIHRASSKRNNIEIIQRSNNEVCNDSLQNYSYNEIETTTIVNAEILLIEQEDDINIITPYLPKVEICQSVDDNIEDQLWGNMPYTSLVNNVNEIYLFKLPTGKSGKMFIEELTFWLHQ